MQWKTASPDRYEILKEFAKENRKFMTEAESVLWQNIKGNSLGHKFLRQYIIGDYIVDFFCRDKRIVIEVDGGYHAEPRQQKDDIIRQEWLESMRYIVLRFTNEEIIGNLDNTLDKIKKYL